MSEVSRIDMAAPLVAGAASSRTKAENPNLPVGNYLPVDKPGAAPNGKPADAESVAKAVADINSYVQSVERDLRFSVDEELNRTVVKVVDSQSGEVVRQIPQEVFLELARNLKDSGEFHLLKAIG